MKQMYTTASRSLDWYKVHQGGGWIGKVTRACHSSLGQVSALEADDRVPFFGANSVIKAVCCRGDLIGSLSLPWTSFPWGMRNGIRFW